ncbi:MAG: type II toxin-antitoxin system VapC family toxin [Candidatus Anammoxibacter sp.]
MKLPFFLDANIIMYAIGKEHPLREPCRKTLNMIKIGKITTVTNTEVLQEIFHRYFSINKPQIGEEAYLAIKTFCSKILPVTLHELDSTLILLKKYSSINTRDAIHAATMINNNMKEIISTNTHFDDILEIKRIAPETL